LKTRKVKPMNSKPGTSKGMEGKVPLSPANYREGENARPRPARREVSKQHKEAALQFNFKITHSPPLYKTNQLTVSGGSFGNLCGRGKGLSAGSEHQPISRSRVGKCSAYFKLRYPLKLYPLRLLGPSEV
jgi:hypothetical protein